MGAIMKQADEAAIAKALGRAIAKKRLERGLTQENVAESLDIGYEAVSRIERGTVMLTIARLTDLAEVFKCGIDELLVESRRRPTDQADYLANLLLKLTDTDRNLVVEIVEKLSARLQKKAR